MKVKYFLGPINYLKKIRNRNRGKAIVVTPKKEEVVNHQRSKQRRQTMKKNSATLLKAKGGKAPVMKTLKKWLLISPFMTSVLCVAFMNEKMASLVSHFTKATPQ